MITADKYLGLFEKNIIIAGIENKMLKINKVMVPVKDGRLDNTNFGKFLGNRLDYDCVLVIDYYGFLKKSTGFINEYNKYTEVEISRLKSNIIHFASIKIENIVNIGV